jgi:hypothetical protein
VPWWEKWKLSPQTEFGLLPCTASLPTSMCSGGYILKIRFKFLHVFGNLSFTTSDNFFNNILSVPSWETWKLSPWTEFGLPPHTTTMPTPMGRSGFILKVRFKFLHLFCSCFVYLHRYLLQ